MTVRENFGLACPLCRSDEDLQVTVELWMDLWPDGSTEPDHNADHIWDNRSECRCRACNHYGTVAEFTVEEGASS